MARSPRIERPRQRATRGSECGWVAMCGAGRLCRAGEVYLLMFLSEKWAFVALRCSDEQVSHGRLLQDPLPGGRLLF